MGRGGILAGCSKDSFCDQELESLNGGIQDTFQTAKIIDSQESNCFSFENGYLVFKNVDVIFKFRKHDIGGDETYSNHYVAM